MLSHKIGRTHTIRIHHTASVALSIFVPAAVVVVVDASCFKGYRMRY